MIEKAMAYQSKAWSIRQLSYVPLFCAGAIIAGIGIVSDFGWLDELLTLAGSGICGWSVAGMRN